MSLTSPVAMAPWMAAPTATTSSGFTLLFGSLPLKSSFTSRCTIGTRVEPPTRTTSSICSGASLASFRASTTGLRHFSTSGRDQLLELRPRQRNLQVLGTVLVGGDERQIDGRFHRAGKFDLGLLGGFLQALQGHRVFAEVDAFGALEFVGQEIDEDLVEVVAAEVGVAVDAEDFEDAVADIEDGDVEGSAAEVEDADFFVLLFIQAISERRGGGLGENAEDFQPGDFTGVLGGLALGVVEIGRDGDDRFGDFLAQIILGGLFEIAEDHGADRFGGVFLAADFHLHQFFGRADDGVGDHLLFAGRLRCAGGP